MAPPRTWPERVRGLVEHDVDLAGDQVLHRRAAAAIGHEPEAGAGRLLEIDGGDLRSAGGADGGGGRLVRDWP